jgi:hypothetical protein
MRKRDARMLLVASFGRRFDIANKTAPKCGGWFCGVKSRVLSIAR